MFSFLTSSVTDDYTLHLIAIARKVTQSPLYQPIIMGLLSSDYMIDEHDLSTLLQVVPLPASNCQIELNTISCSFLGVEEKLTQLHQFLLSADEAVSAPLCDFMGVSAEQLRSYAQQPGFNLTLQNACRELAAAVRVYNEQ